jgi:sulfur-carrier protein
MMMTVQLFGRFRDFHSDPELVVELPEVHTGADFRAAFDAWALAHWPSYNSGLLKACAIATESTLLHANSTLPADGRVAILPPVSGG